jgi:putative nucleotidyltransferase with HDIG domain
MLSQHEDMYKTLLELSFEISEVIINTTDRVMMYKKILDRLCDKLGFDYAEVWEMSKDDRLVKTNIMAVRNSSMEGFADISQNYSFRFGEGIPGITWKDRQPQWIANVQEEQNFLRRVAAKTYDVRTGVTMPIFAYDYLDAVCFFFSKRELVRAPMFLELLNHFARIIGINIIKEELNREVKNTLQEKKNEKEINMRTVNKIFDLRDPYTISHQSEVAEFSKTLGKHMGLDDDAINDLYLGGSYHDIGKIEIPQEILSKPRSLNKEEYNLVKRHPNTGYEILIDSSLSKNVKRIVLEHHERLDGSGYPNQLRGNEIHDLSKIVAVSDVISAMQSHRPYRAALPSEVVINELRNQAGISLDKDITNLAIDVLCSK